MRPSRIRKAAEVRLGRYELLEELGRGAMGVVYKARDPQIDRLVAIKTICNLAGDFELQDSYRTRFLLEAKAAGRLSHRGIVQVFDVAEEEGTRTPYIVMEYVPGISLSRMLTGGTKLPTESALRLAQEVAEALSYAHSQGVVHRDVKPSNIMVTDEGHAKLTDLGVSKLDCGNGTAGGQLVGTPAYMAPEQLKNSSNVDGRADLFSVGVILYWMLSGHRPFQGNSSKTVAFKINHHAPVPVTAFNLEVPPEIDYVLARAMAKDPSQRYQTGTEMALDLQDLRDGNKPRSGTDFPANGALRQSSNAREGYFQILADIANSPLVSRSPGGIREQPASRRFALLPSARNVGISIAVVIAIGVTYLSIRARAPWGSAPATSATGEFRSVPAPVVSHNVTTPVPPAVRPADSVVPSRAPEAIPKKRPSPPATQASAGSKLQVIIEHQFDEAQVSVWIDDRLAYSDSLRGGKKRRLLLFPKVDGRQSRVVQLSPGEHRLRVRIQSAADGYDLEDSILGTFANDATRTLQVACDKSNKKLQLRLA